MKVKSLQELRKNMDLTQVQAAKKLKITPIYLSMLETADRNPSDNLKLKMSKLYRCEISDIFLAINSTKCLKNRKEGE